MSTLNKAVLSHQHLSQGVNAHSRQGNVSVKRGEPWGSCHCFHSLNNFNAISKCGYVQTTFYGVPRLDIRAGLCTESKGGLSL